MPATTTRQSGGWTAAGSGWRQRARAWARAARHTPDRVLHALRRHRAQRAHGALPRSVLFVCYGNICRSPYAAEAFTRLIGGGPPIRVASAGFVGPGRSSPPEAQAVARTRGIDLAGHRSQLITAPLLAEYDVVIVMSSDHRRDLARRFGRRSGVLLLGDLDTRAIETRTITDPFNRPEQVFAEVYDRIDRCLGRLWEVWRNGGGGPR